MSLTIGNILIQNISFGE